MTADEQLLAAAFLPGSAALEAWAAWRDDVDIDLLDRPRRALLPQLYRNLTALGIRDATVERLRSPYRHTWAANQLRLRSASSAVEALAGNSVEVRLVGGAALALTAYADTGARMIELPELLVSAKSRSTALKVLRSSGWRAQGELARRTLRPAIRGRQLLTDADDTVLAVTWRAARAGELLRDPGREVGVHGVRVTVPGRAALLAEACQAATAGEETTRLPRVADLLALARSASESDWLDLERMARGPDRVEIAEAVSYVHRTFGIGAPAVAVRA